MKEQENNSEVLTGDVVDSVTTKLDKLRSLPEEERNLQIWDARVKGVPVQAIAKAFDMPIRDIYVALKKVGAIYRQELLELDAIDIIASQIQWLDEMERVALAEAHQLQTQVIKHFDQETGKVVEERLVDPNRAKFFQAALEARRMKLKILAETGVLPKDNPEALFRKLSSLEKKDENTQEERTEAEILETIDRLMKHGRFIKTSTEIKQSLNNDNSKPA